MRTRDYRNGVLVGYTEHDWTAFAFGNTTITIPRPTGNINVSTCPGQSHTYTVVFQDSTLTDSVMATLISNSLNIPVAITGGSGVGSATAVLTWTTPATLNPAVTKYFTIRLKVRDQVCPRPGVAWYDVVVRTAPCMADTAWPGDADGDKVVNLYDPLAIALAFGNTGLLRPNASTTWTAQPGPDWSTSFLNGVNHKHADCNGNGTVNNNDLNAVTLNYGQTHPRPGEEGEQPKTAGLPDLYFDHTGISAVPGTAVTIPVKLGTTGSQMTGLYGFATRIQIQNVAPTMSPTVTYPTSWLGTGTNTLRFAAGVNNATLDWAYARTTGTAVSGDGTLAHISIPIPATTPLGTQMILRFTQVRLVGPTGVVLGGYNVLSDTMTVVATADVNDVVSSVQSAAVVPNPSSREAVLHLSVTKAQSLTVSVSDAVGRAVWTRQVATGATSVELPAAVLPAGMYLIRIVPTDGSAGRMVKWVRE